MVEVQLDNKAESKAIAYFYKNTFERLYHAQQCSFSGFEWKTIVSELAAIIEKETKGLRFVEPRK